MKKYRANNNKCIILNISTILLLLGTWSLNVYCFLAEINNIQETETYVASDDDITFNSSNDPLYIPESGECSESSDCEFSQINYEDENRCCNICYERVTNLNSHLWTVHCLDETLLKIISGVGYLQTLIIVTLSLLEICLLNFIFCWMLYLFYSLLKMCLIIVDESINENEAPTSTSKSALETKCDVGKY